MLSWEGLDNGREGLLRRDKWFRVLRILAAHEGEDHTDLSSPLFDALDSAMPEESWRGGASLRSLFRDYAKAWTALGVLRPTLETNGSIELTRLGRELVENPSNLTEFFRMFIDNYLEYWSTPDGTFVVAPFFTIATQLQARPRLSKPALQTSCESFVLGSLPTSDTFAATANARRRFRSYLILLENAQAIEVSGQEVVVMDSLYVQSLWSAGGAPDLVPRPAAALGLDDDGRTRVLGQRVVREGQVKFKSKLMVSYAESCAITGATEKRVLEAAHIKPYMGRHTNLVSNGLLLAVDVHRLFDDFLISIDPSDLTIRVHPSVTDPRYRSLEGRALATPASLDDRPDSGALAEHYEHFKMR